MGKDKKYIITRSNYTVKKKHKTLNDNRTIYERDFMITNSNDTWNSNGSSYGISSFKMVRDIKNGGHYRYNSGEWLKQDACTDNSEIWTYNCVANKEDKNDENNIKIIPNYNSLLNFAYYRSCKDLIQLSINDIIKRFPAELYFSSKKYDLDGESVYIIENQFKIDLHTQSLNGDDIRLFSQSYDKYFILKNGIKEDIIKVDIKNIGTIRCAENDDLLYLIEIKTENEIYLIEGYYRDGEIFYTFDDEELIGLRIRPKENIVNEFFNNLDKFQEVMLNRNTNPLYTMYLDYPHETDYGIETYRKRFTWPIINEWNLDISGGEYEIYVDDLLTLCDFYDNRRTDNLWRVMTHDSIKNMDYAFKNDKIEEDEYGLGESRFEKIIKCYAKQFDDIKQYIDNIKSVNNISYNPNSNTPNYFLSDKLEMSGWEVYNLSNSLSSNSNVQGNKLFKNINKIYNVSDINVDLMRYLQINSKDILSRKGTKHGIEMLLGLFGLTSYDHNKNDYDYKITEYVDTVIDNSRADFNDVMEYNTKKNNYTEKYLAFEESYNDPLQNLPLRLVEYEVENGNYKSYVIPWFDKKQTLDGNIYFQMNGGWCKIFKKDLNNKPENTDDIVLDKTINIYDETIKYLLIVKNIDDLKYIVKDKLYNGCIVYVTSIQDFDSVYENDDKRTISLNGENNTLKASNYFILENVRNSYTIGSYKDSENKTIYGWENITIKEIEDSNKDNTSNRGLKIKLMESIVENHKGNNPHGGYGKYDDGEAYLDYFKQIFKFSIENDNFPDILYSCENGELDEKIKNIGFDIEKQVDNVKTWYFIDSTIINNKPENSIGGLKEITLNVNVVDGEGITQYKGEEYKGVKCGKMSYEITPQKIVKVGEENEETFYESHLKPFDFEGIGNRYDESVANSIINDKKILIEFSGPIIRYDNDFPLFLQEGILPYLKQMIPSTSIVEIRIEGEHGSYVTLPFAKSNVEEAFEENEKEVEITD